MKYISLPVESNDQLKVKKLLVITFHLVGRVVGLYVVYNRFTFIKVDYDPLNVKLSVELSPKASPAPYDKLTLISPKVKLVSY